MRTEIRKDGMGIYDVSGGWQSKPGSEYKGWDQGWGRDKEAGTTQIRDWQ